MNGTIKRLAWLFWHFVHTRLRRTLTSTLCAVQNENGVPHNSKDEVYLHWKHRGNMKLKTSIATHTSTRTCTTSSLLHVKLHYNVKGVCETFLQECFNTFHELRCAVDLSDLFEFQLGQLDYRRYCMPGQGQLASQHSTNQNDKDSQYLAPMFKARQPLLHFWSGFETSGSASFDTHFMGKCFQDNTQSP